MDMVRELNNIDTHRNVHTTVGMNVRTHFVSGTRYRIVHTVVLLLWNGVAVEAMPLFFYHCRLLAFHWLGQYSMYCIAAVL